MDFGKAPVAKIPSIFSVLQNCRISIFHFLAPLKKFWIPLWENSGKAHSYGGGFGKSSGLSFVVNFLIGRLQAISYLAVSLKHKLLLRYFIKKRFNSSGIPVFLFYRIHFMTF